MSGDVTTGSYDGTPAPSGTDPRMAGARRPVGMAMLSLLLLLGAWEALAVFGGSDALSGPGPTARAVLAAQRDGYLLPDLEVTTARLLAAFALGFSASLVVGLALGLSPQLNRLFGLWVTIASSMPAVVYVVACYLVIGINDTAAVLAVAMIVMPTAATAIADGVKNTDPGLREMARAFGTQGRRTLWQVTVPQAAPWIFTAARTCWSLTWRIMVFVELIGRPDGVGYRIQYWFNLADMSRVMASALPLVALIVTVDIGVFRVCERRLNRWQVREMT